MKKMGTCFIGCGEMLNTMGKKCVDVEANGSEQSEKLASPLGSDSEMEVDDQSPDETQKSNSNNIECCERSNISFLDFLFEFFLTFCLDKLYSSAFGQLFMPKY